MKKAWLYISVFLTGIIAGMIVFGKVLSDPGVEYHIQIKKLKSKGNTGPNSGILPTITVEQDDNATEEKEPKKRLRNLFKRNK